MDYPTGMRYGLLCLVLLAAAGRVGAADIIDARTPVQLGPDEGVVALVLDTNTWIKTVQIDRIGGLFGGEIPMGFGRHTVFFKARAGDYRWQRLNWSFQEKFWDLRGSDAYTFHVEPGVVNYPGDFVAWLSGGGVMRFRWVNCSAHMLETIGRDYDTALGKLPFHYQGKLADPYPEFYRAALDKAGPAAVTRMREAIASAPEPSTSAPGGIPPEELYRLGGLQAVRLSPDGRLLAEHWANEGDHVISVTEIASGRKLDAYKNKAAIGDLAWSGSTNLVVEFDSTHYQRDVAVIRVDMAAGAKHPVERIDFPVAGRVIDPLRNDPDHIVFLRVVGGDAVPLQLFRVDISGKRIGLGAFKRPDRLNVKLTHDSGWLIDRRGLLRAAMVTSGGHATLTWRDADSVRFRDVLSVPVDRTFMPMALSPDEQSLIAVTDIDRGQRDVVRVDPATGKITETVYSLPGVDVEGVVLRPGDGAVIGARITARGQMVVHYFADDARERQAVIEKQFPGQQVGIVDIDTAGTQQLIATFGATNPGSFHRYDTASGKFTELGSEAPHLRKYAFVAPEVFTVRSPDGLDIEALLTRPAGTDKIPVVVMPHGGPHGVRDVLGFNHDVQYLASRGLAVLQVNYRGSGGFGREFFEAGYRSRGTAIEDDIERALDYALVHYPLDKDRVCMVGESYGGYSALMALVRHGERYRCAVSIAGVTDVPLQFTASDWNSDAGAQAMMTKMVGDPTTEMAGMIAVSPLYQYEKIKQPVMLVHGMLDERVPQEHSDRLQQMLSLAGRPPTVLYIGGQGHGFTSLNAVVVSQRAIADFLDQHLKPARTGSIFTAQAEDTAVKVLRDSSPTYPQKALDAGVEGTAQVRVLVRANGAIDTVEIQQSSGSADLDAAALETVRQWCFTVARKGGRAIDAGLTVPIAFALEKK